VATARSWIGLIKPLKYSADVPLKSDASGYSFVSHDWVLCSLLVSARDRARQDGEDAATELVPRVAGVEPLVLSLASRRWTCRWNRFAG
jgi:hypothetical protein